MLFVVHTWDRALGLEETCLCGLMKLVQMLETTFVDLDMLSEV